MSHQADIDLAKTLADAREKIPIGARYRHYKNNQTYITKAVALLEESTEPCVVYQAEYGERITWIRPLANWLEEIEWEGKMVPRFASESSQAK